MLCPGEHCWENDQGSGKWGGARDQGEIFLGSTQFHRFNHFQHVIFFVVLFCMLLNNLFANIRSSKTIDKISDGDDDASAYKDICLEFLRLCLCFGKELDLLGGPRFSNKTFMGFERSSSPESIHQPTQPLFLLFHSVPSYSVLLTTPIQVVVISSMTT